MFSEESRVLVKTKKAKRHSENTKGLEMLENLGISEIRVGGERPSREDCTVTERKVSS